MSAPATLPKASVLRDGGGLLARRPPRVALVLGFTLALLLMWSTPGLKPLWHDTGWLPLWLHTTAETFSIVVSVMVFAVIWTAYDASRPANLVLLACAFLGMGLLDFGHVLAYREMPDFITPSGPQKSVGFWLCARLLGALTLVWISFRSWQPLADPRTRHALLAGTLGLVGAIFYLLLFHPSAWPQFYIEGRGLTALKIGLEAAVIAALALVALRLLQLRKQAPGQDLEGLLTAVLLWIVSELALVTYDNVNDAYSLLGHVGKVAAYLMIYRVAFVASVLEPYERLAVESAEREAAELQVEALAFYDPLSGLPNKTLLRDRAAQILAARELEQGQSALMLVNVDGLKHINDSFGQGAGDAVLHAVAERLPFCVDASDTVSRLGGDEFALMLRAAPDAESVALVQERIFTAMAKPVVLAGQGHRVTVSIGVAIAPEDGGDFDTLFQHASIALHRAKDSGGNAWRFYNATMNQEAAERLQLRNGLRQALERGEFVLHYQPQFDLHSHALVGVEALVRWQHPEQGLVAPMRFIPEAEDSGLIVPIGKWILHEACEQAMAWRRAGLQVPRVAVNLSAKQFQREDVVTLVREALMRSGLPASELELELTESILIQDAEAVLATVRQLRAIGVHLSIDDFGTGYSSLSYLRDFPLDKLKVDQSFVRELGKRPDGEAIVAAIIQLARSLGLETIAEGVEDASAAEVLLRLGCDQAQGYLYARPMAPQALQDFLMAARG